MSNPARRPSRRGGGRGEGGLQQHGYSLAAGTLGALASVVGKLGLDAAALPPLLPKAAAQQDGPSSWLLPALRAACVGAMLACNAAMTSCYVQALHHSGSVPATVISAALNFVLTGVAGWAVFREALSLRWWAGAGLTLMGVALVAGWGFEGTKQGAEERPGLGRYQLRERTPQKPKKA